jgi:glycosyltransferase involved in cell wall biosynthesis
MKILHLISGLEHGGSQTMLTELAPYLNRYGIISSVVSMTSGSSLAVHLEMHNIPVIPLNMSRGRPSLIGFGKLLSIIHQYQPDVLQTWMYHADLAGGLAGRLSGVPVVWGIHHTVGANHMLKPGTWTVVQLNQILSGLLPAQIACCSQSAYDSHLAMGFERTKMTLAINGIDTTRFQPNPGTHRALCTQLGIPVSSVLIGHCGRFHPAKGHSLFIQAAAKLKVLYPQAHFVMCGEEVDWDNPQLADWIAQAELGNRIHLLGLQTQLEQILPGLDLLVSSSLIEALPLVVCEAMSCQVPCVVTDVGDQAKVVADSGICVKNGSVTELVNGCSCLLNLSQAERDQLGSQARARVLANFSLKNTAEKYLSIYSQVINKESK